LNASTIPCAGDFWLDYHLATPAFAALARSEAIYKDERFSDHAPITVGYEFTL
jgi:exodeoxyribonuclease-3